MGYSELILSFADTDAGNVAFQYVRNSKSPDYEDGNIEVAWNALKGKFAPQTAPTEIALYRKFYESKLRKGVDPDVWISQMEDTRMRLAEMKSTMTDKHFLMHLINNLTQEYEYTVALVEKRLDDVQNPLTLEELRADLNLRFERLGLRSKHETEEDIELDMALAAGGKFKGKCRKCGKIGHKVKDCKSNGFAGSSYNLPQNSYNKNYAKNSVKGSDGWTKVQPKKFGNNNGGRFEGICNYCKLSGHKWVDCRKRIQDESNGARAGSAHIGQNWKSKELLFMATPATPKWTSWNEMNCCKFIGHTKEECEKYTKEKETEASRNRIQVENKKARAGNHFDVPSNKVTEMAMMSTPWENTNYYESLSDKEEGEENEVSGLEEETDTEEQEKYVKRTTRVPNKNRKSDPEGHVATWGSPNSGNTSTDLPRRSERLQRTRQTQDVEMSMASYMSICKTEQKSPPKSGSSKKSPPKNIYAVAASRDFPELSFKHKHEHAKLMKTHPKVTSQYKITFIETSTHD